MRLRVHKFTSNHYCWQGVWYGIKPDGNTFVKDEEYSNPSPDFPNSVKTFYDIGGMMAMD